MARAFEITVWKPHVGKRAAFMKSWAEVAAIFKENGVSDITVLNGHAGKDVGHIVIIQNSDPAIDVKRLLNHPSFRERLFYLRGDISNSVDLKRLKASLATGLFLLSSDSSTSSSDKSILMQSIMVKNCEPGIPIFTQIVSPKSIPLSQSCGSDRVLCVQEMKINLMARNCLVPGLVTLLTNLINTYPEASIDLENSEYWKKDYQSGVDNQIHSFRVPAGLVGVPMAVAIKYLYRDLGAILFGIMPYSSGFYTGNVTINPGMDYKLKDGDIALIIAEKDDDIVAYIQIQYNIPFSWEGTTFLDDEESIVKTSNFQEISDETALSTNLESIPMLELPETSSKPDFKSHLIIAGRIPMEMLRDFIFAIRRSGFDEKHAISSINAHQNIHIVCIRDSSPEKDDIYDSIINERRIDFVIGESGHLDTLREAGIDKCKKVSFNAVFKL